MSRLAGLMLDELTEGDLDVLAERLAPRLAACLLRTGDQRGDELLSAHEAAQRARAHVETIRRAVRRGELAAAQVGRSLRIRSADLEAWLAPSPRDLTRPQAPRRPRRRAGRRPMAEALARLEIDP